MARFVRRFVDLGIRLGTWIVAILTAVNIVWFLGNCVSAEVRMLRFDTHGFSGAWPSLRGGVFAALGPVATAGYFALAALILIGNGKALRRVLKREPPLPDRELAVFGRAYGLVLLGLFAVVLARVVLGWIPVAG
ncbi:MAG: hypothetical protein IPK07_13095 [Deltaproteobacteria bacterium]|nr:hypothetical protein [Deltaproteobacteria bacterium]